MIKVFETFAGYGGWSFALKQLSVENKVVGYSEVDKYAIQCYEQNHNGKNYGDITKINPHDLPDFDLYVSSPPCQAFSIAGKGQGKDDDKNRGRLFEDAIEIMRVKQPKYAVYENVKGLTFKTHKDYFDYIIRLMKDAGYVVYWKVLNTKEHGIPQNRERVFIVCIRLDVVDDSFKFPEKQELKLFLKDIVERDVPKKYFLSDKKLKTFTKEIFPEGDESDIVSVAIRNKNRSKHQSLGLPYGTFPKQLHLQFNRDIGVSFAVKSATHEYMVANIKLENIRHLTPKECFRLQGFFKDEINLDGLSEQAKYKLAGNGVSINVCAKLLRNLLK